MDKIRNRLSNGNVNVYVLSVLLLALIFAGYKYYSLSKTFDTTVNDLNKNLSETKSQKDNLLMELNNLKDTNSAFEGQIASITNTVGDLTKLKETDPELLKKYSKIYFLNENYVPAELSKIDPKYVYSGKEQYFHTRAIPFLVYMLNDARGNGINLEVLSAFRSFESQTTLKTIYKMTYGSGANQFSADQGYSEHQLGTAVDFTTKETAPMLSGFSKTTAYKWLTDHAHEYGFTLSYPSNNTYYQFEPWHWRFVGIKLATYLHNNKMYFYDLDQRAIDKYLINLFDIK